MQARIRIADFWDDVLVRWLDGQEIMGDPTLKRWAGAYTGTGVGKVDLRHYPDPYVGDLRGEAYNPRLVLLGLNPGIGFNELQARDGVWAERIRRDGLSRCFARSPAEDRETWLQHRGKPSRYWENAERFAKRWLRDDAAGVHDILNIELYPWHSISKTAALQVPPDIVAEYVLAPLAEVDVPVVFAFGADWMDVAPRLGLELLAAPTPAALGGSKAQWRVGIFRLNQNQRLVISSQAGYAGPPGPERLDLLRSVVGSD